MAKHWSTEMYVLCWSDMSSNGRRRMSWHKDRSKLEAMAADMPEGAEPVLYSGFASRLGIGGWERPAPKKKTKQRAKKAPVAEPQPAAA